MSAKIIALNREPVNPKKIPPPLEDVIEYGQTIGMQRDSCEEFHDYFEAIGWLVSGKTPMKNWQAAMRNWKRRSIKYNQNKQTQAPGKRHWTDRDLDVLGNDL